MTAKTAKVELTTERMAPLSVSLEEIVKTPEDCSTIPWNTVAPSSSAWGGGREACGAVVVLRATGSVTRGVTFQYASVARTVALKALPANWARDPPPRPWVEPGSETSPGSRICRRWAAPAAMGTAAATADGIPAAAGVKVATRGDGSARRMTTGNVARPRVRGAGAGADAKGSSEPTWTLKVALRTFRNSLETARTVTVNVVPATWDAGAPVLPECSKKPSPGAWSTSPGVNIQPGVLPRSTLSPSLAKRLLPGRASESRTSAAVTVETPTLSRKAEPAVVLRRTTGVADDRPLTRRSETVKSLPAANWRVVAGDNAENTPALKGA